MKKILLYLIVASLSLSADSDMQKEKEALSEQALQKVLKDEQKFAREQKFYDHNTYDFKGSEVNEKSLQYIQRIEPMYDFDMTHVYD